MRMRYKDLIFPKAMNLDILSEILSDDEMMILIKKFKGEERRERRIVLPSRKLIRKCVIFYLAQKHEENFDEVLKELKVYLVDPADEDMLRRDKIIELYKQRKKEIENENE